MSGSDELTPIDVERVPGFGIQVNAIAPGNVNTETARLRPSAIVLRATSNGPVCP